MRTLMSLYFSKIGRHLLEREASTVMMWQQREVLACLLTLTLL
jgi:hypothetical protein